MGFSTENYICFVVLLIVGTGWLVMSFKKDIKNRKYAQELENRLRSFELERERQQKKVLRDEADEWAWERYKTLCQKADTDKDQIVSLCVGWEIQTRAGLFQPKFNANILRQSQALAGPQSGAGLGAPGQWVGL